MFGLGDSAYDETFANGSAVLINALNAAKAQQIGERGVHDASGLEDAIDLALPWAAGVIAEAEKA